MDTKQARHQTDPASAAAAQAEARIHIQASAARVWALLTDVQAWPRWNAAVTSVAPAQPAAVGHSFHWRSQGFAVQSTFAEVQAPTRLAWAGRALGTRAWHLWEIESVADGVVVRTCERFDGWLPRLMPKSMQRKLEATLPAWLHALKSEAERASELG